MKTPPTSMQHLTIKRIPIKNANTVRYRVYTSADEFVAVIAENALMAMKLTGVNEPYKVVRDLITEEGSVPEEALDKERTEMLSLNTVQDTTRRAKPDPKQFTNAHAESFQPLSMGALRKENSLLEGVIPSPKLLRVLEDSVPAVVSAEPAPEPVSIPAAPEPAEEDTEISPLNMAQQTLVNKAEGPAAPLSAKDVVDLLSSKSD